MAIYTSKEVTQSWVQTSPLPFEVLNFGKTYFTYTGATDIDHAIVSPLVHLTLNGCESKESALHTHTVPSK